MREFEGKCYFSPNVVSTFCGKTLEKQIYKEEKMILANDSKDFKPCPAFEGTAKRELCDRTTGVWGCPTQKLGKRKKGKRQSGVRRLGKG